MMISATEKQCVRCEVIKPATADYFYFQNGRPHGCCIECNNGPEELARRRAYSLRVRHEVIDAYGGLCECCNDDTFEFLGIDHIDGGGNTHRKALREAGTTTYLWLRKNGYPEGYRVLCHNCNLAMGFYGACPHQT